MSLPPASTSKTDALAAEAILETAANNEFIAETTLAIADAVSQGQFTLYVYSIPGMNIQTIFAYFKNLGYIIGDPASLPYQAGPAELFGEFWVAYWQNQFPRLPNFPIKLFIAWYLPSN